MEVLYVCMHVCFANGMYIDIIMHVDSPLVGASAVLCFHIYFALMVMGSPNQFNVSCTVYKQHSWAMLTTALYWRLLSDSSHQAV